MDRRIKSFSGYVSKFISEERLQQLGKESKFSQRKSAITPKAFLEAIFFGNIHHSSSLEQHTLDLAECGIRKVTKQAVDKRFNSNTLCMLETVLNKILAAQIGGKQLPENLKSHFTDIRIMDSTEFKVSKKAAAVFPGYGGVGREAMVQIQLEYQLFDKNISRISIGSALDSDHTEGLKTIKDIKPNTLLLRDLAYVSSEYFRLLKSKGLYYISRAKSQWSLFIEKDGKHEPLTTMDIIGILKGQKEKYLDIEVLLGSGKKEPMRLVANLLDQEQKKKRLKRKKANRQKLGKDAMEGMGLNLFVTNVEKEKCSADAIFQLYSLRWQIELMFKTWKSVVRINEIHSMNAIRLECIILVKLVWIMLNWTILKMLQTVTDKDISYHKLSKGLLGRSKMLTNEILNNAGSMEEWLLKLSQSVGCFKKEYKKGRRKIDEITTLTNCK